MDKEVSGEIFAGVYAYLLKMVGGGCRLQDNLTKETAKISNIYFETSVRGTFLNSLVLKSINYSFVICNLQRQFN